MAEKEEKEEPQVIMLVCPSHGPAAMGESCFRYLTLASPTPSCGGKLLQVFDISISYAQLSVPVLSRCKHILVFR